MRPLPFRSARFVVSTIRTPNTTTAAATITKSIANDRNRTNTSRRVLQQHWQPIEPQQPHTTQQQQPPQHSNNLHSHCQNLFNYQQRRLLSSPSSSGTSNTKKSNLTLRRLARPFIATFHPDRQATDDTTTIARETNLKAIQTLNGMIDTIEYLCDRSSGSKTTSATGRGRVELEARYTIEFLVPSASAPTAIKRVKVRDAPTSTRRSLDLTFTEREREILRTIGSDGKPLGGKAVERVRVRAMMELRRLLRVAGLGVPSNLDNELEKLVETMDKEDGNDEDDFRTNMIHGDLGLRDDENEDNIFAKRGASSSTHRKTRYEQSRERYLCRFQKQQKKLKRIYERVLEDHKRDAATSGMMTEERKQMTVADIISRVMIHDSSSAKKDDEGNRGGDDDRTLNNVQEDNDEEEDEEEDDGLSPIGQLIALRRLSLLFYDNFETLQIESMGRLWSNTSIVLTPQRTTNPVVNKPFSRKLRVQKGRESGFKFTYRSDGGCTVHVPVDFTDEEVLGELDRHLYDFHMSCMENDELESFFPSYYKEFKVRPEHM